MSESRTSSAVGAVPDDPQDVKTVFKKHHDYYRGMAGEVAHQQQNGEDQIQREYSGRVIFELLQNALDRAESTVTISLRETDRAAGEYVLVVTNDGDGIRVNPSYEYDSPPDAGSTDGKRPDFNALCSVSTSNKSPDESIGTKGIGFRSVFSLDTHVRVWSEFANHDGWWGLEMHAPFDSETWHRRRTEPAIKRGRERLLESDGLSLTDGEQRPSYHFPLPLYSETRPAPVTTEAAVSTAVVVPVKTEHVDNLAARIKEFESKHLYFVGLDPDNRDVTVRFGLTDEEPFERRTWSSDGGTSPGDRLWGIAEYGASELTALAQEADHDVSEPTAAVAWPPANRVDQRDQAGVAGTVYGYLPTLVDAPFDVDIQGDFQLSIDRTNIRLDDDKMGSYNGRLLKIAAELHLLQVLRTVDETLVRDVPWDEIEPTSVGILNDSRTGSPRADLWRFLDPSSGGSPAAKRIVKHVQSLLFDAEGKDEETYTLWSRLAAQFFETREEWSVGTFEQFWAASTAWVDRICSTKSRQKNWRRTALAMCDALRAQEASVAPIIFDSDPDTTGDVPAVPLPERGTAASGGGKTSRHERKLFLRSADDAALSLPTAMTEENRAVTAFDFPSALHSGTPNALGTTEFNRWEVISELRQLPNSLKDWSPSPLAGDKERAIEQQRELIAFAAELYLLETETNYATPRDLSSDGPGWRALPAASDAARRAGRSVATLYLPTDQGTWLPARQLSKDRVADDQLGDLPDDLPLDEFLTFLGVAPAAPEDDAKPLTLVEGGNEGPSRGLVSERDIPPKLTAAGPGLMDLTLGSLPPSKEPTEPEAWYQSLIAADEWLLPVIEAEHTAMLSDDDSDQFDQIDLLNPLGERPWFPVADEDDNSGASPPGWATGQQAVAPRDLLVTARPQHLGEILWTVDRASDAEPLLMVLGAVDGTDSEDLSAAEATAAFRLLDQIRRPSPDIFDDQPRVRDEFVRLFERILEAIVRGDDTHSRKDDVAVLVYQSADEQRVLTDRALEWRELNALADDDVWLPETDTVREDVRRLFPNVPQVAATIGPRVLGEYPVLADHSVSVTRTVNAELWDETEDGPDASAAAEAIADELRPVVPKLLALAEADRDISVALTEEAERWGPGLFEPVANVWREFRADVGTGPTEPVSEYKDDDQTALLYTEDGAEGTETTSRIQFDLTADGGHPPLEAFGRPLADLLLAEDTAQAASLFEMALQTHESDGESLDRLLERRDAHSLVDSYDRRITSLDDAARADLLERTRRALDDLGLRLTTTAVTRLRTLRPADLEVVDIPPDLTVPRVEAVLDDLELSEDQEPFRPGLVWRSVNRRRWDEWFDTHREDLAPYLVDLLRPEIFEDIEEETLAARLDDYVRSEACDRIMFQPESVVIGWLQTVGIDADRCPDDLLEAARRFVPSYDRVDTVSVATEAGWRPAPPSEVSPDGDDDAGTVTEADLRAKRRAQKAAGTDAERMALKKVTAQTQDVLESLRGYDTIETVRGSVDDPWEVLRWPIPAGGVTAETLREAQERYENGGGQDALEHGLHISGVWDGAGFDLLGLDWVNSDGEIIQPVRYEIKAISDSNIVGLHLSEKQLSVHDAVHDSSIDDRRQTGDWRLWGIESGGTAVDFTDDLERLPEEALKALRESGFDHDGLVLRVSRHGAD